MTYRDRSAGPRGRHTITTWYDAHVSRRLGRSWGHNSGDRSSQLFFFPSTFQKETPKKKKIEIVLLNVQSIRKNETPTRLMKVEMEEFVSCRSLGTISRPPSRQLFYFMIRPNFFFFCYAGRLNSARVDGTLVIGELNSTLYYDKCSINSGVLRWCHSTVVRLL